MSSRNLLLLIISVVFIIGAVVIVRGRMAAHAPKPVATVTHGDKILVAKRDISTGSFVKTAQDLQWVEWPAANMQPSYIREGTEELRTFEGAVARHTVHTGEAITTNELIKPGAGGFLSAVLDPGKRAVSVAVSATSGTAGFIFPGDRVDLIVTHHMKLKEAPGAEEEDKVIGETFIHNVRVVAVDQMLDNPENKAILAKTVTVEVSPTQAEKVSVAQDMGKISFALCSLMPDDTKPAPVKLVAQEGGDKDQDLVSELTQPRPVPPAKSVTRDSDISPMLLHSGNISPRVRVIRGDVSEQREFYRSAQ